MIGNLVKGNEADRNGLKAGGAGVLLASPIDGVVRNNRLGDFGTSDPVKTVGIYIGSNSPLTIVVKGNDIRNDDIGIFQAGPTVTTVRRGNDFRHVGQPFVAIPDFQ